MNSKKVLLTATVQSHICQFHKPLMKLLKDNGYEVHIAARDNLAEKNGLKIEYADKVFNIPFDRSPFSFKNITAYKELTKVLEQNDYDIIHTNTPMGGVVTRLAANKYRKKNGTKVFYTAHGFHFYKGAPKKNWLIYYPIEKAMSHFTDKLITITNEDYKLAEDKFNCNVYHIHGVGANSEKFYVMSDSERDELRSQLGFSWNSPIILNVGELLPNKNQKAAIIAMKKITETIPDCKLIIAGNGSEHDNLESLIKELKLENNVELIGYTTELYKYMNICNVLVACSFREGLPLNLMEAMLCAKPIVASNNRGHRELVKNGKNGYLVDPSDTDAYAEKIISVLQSTEEFSENALKYVEPFKDTSVLNELKALYELEV